MRWLESRIGDETQSLLHSSTVQFLKTTQVIHNISLFFLGSVSQALTTHAQQVQAGREPATACDLVFLGESPHQSPRIRSRLSSCVLRTTIKARSRRKQPCHQQTYFTTTLAHNRNSMSLFSTIVINCTIPSLKTSHFSQAEKSVALMSLCVGSLGAPVSAIIAEVPLRKLDPSAYPTKAV